MRQVKLLFAFMAFVFVTHATTYLVQPGGTGAAWSGVSGTVVDLTVQGQSLNDWYKATAITSADQIWIIQGTYTLTDSIVTKSTEKIYGGFAGTETTIGARAKGTNAWDFTNETILDGHTSVRGLVSTTGATIDGLSVQNCAYTDAGNCAAAVKITGSSILQNCIVRNNTITGSSTATTGFYSGGVYLSTSGQLLNSYIHHNSCANTYGGGNGGGITIYGLVTVDGCTISNNTAYTSGGGVQLYAQAGGTLITNCTITNNTASNGGGGGVNLSNQMAFITPKVLTFSNCNISSNNALHAPQYSGGGGMKLDAKLNGTYQTNPVSITNCTVSGNATNGTNLNGGGGILLSNGVYTISGCTINNNTATLPNNDNTGGGGIYSSFNNGSGLVVSNTTIKGNTLSNGSKNNGSAVFGDVSNGKFTNCILTGNVGNTFFCLQGGRNAIFKNCTLAGNTKSDGTTEAGMYLGYQTNTTSTFTNCLFYKCGDNPISVTGTSSVNPTVSYCGFSIAAVPSTYTNRTGCITGLSAADFTNATNGDWSLSTTSAAIDAGTTLSDVTTDFLGTARPQGAAYDMGAYEYHPNTNVTTAVNSSSLSLTANDVVTVSAGGTLTVDAPTTMGSLTIKQGGRVTNSSGQSLTTTNFTINSDATGTGTYVDNGTTTISGIAKVNQSLTGLTGSSTRPWWYISSPVSGATAAVFNVAAGVNKMTSYDETVPGYRTQFSSNATALNPGVGYVTYIGGGDATYTFSTNTGVATAKLNTGSISVPVTRTGTTAGKRGFNLIGNPYPSYLDWGQVDTTNVLSTIWYRSYSSAGTSMVFDTYNGKLGIAINNSNNGNTLSQFIPPMQAFWVKVRSEKADVSGLTVNFTNAMRSHQSSSVAGLLRSPKSTDQKVLRLQVSNGIISDETVIATNANASNGFDDYDSPKLSNDNVAIPEIYTMAGTEMVAINGLNSITIGQELPLGFTTGASNNFSIRATRVSNFDADTKIILKDNLLTTEQDITDGTPYSFSSDASNTTGRFTVIFKSASVATGIDTNVSDNQGMFVFKNANNQIVINRTKTLGQEGIVTIFNALGQKLVSTTTTGPSTVISKSFSAGVYLVTLNVSGKKITEKVIVN